MCVHVCVCLCVRCVHVCMCTYACVPSIHVCSCLNVCAWWGGEGNQAPWSSHVRGTHHVKFPEPVPSAQSPGASEKFSGTADPQGPQQQLSPKALKPHCPGLQPGGHLQGIRELPPRQAGHSAGATDVLAPLQTNIMSGRCGTDM